MFIFDAHLDLSLNALDSNRDYTQALRVIRERERWPRSEEAYRPLSNEDARYEVELRSAKAISRATRDLACRGSAKKLARRVAGKRREAAATR